MIHNGTQCKYQSENGKIHKIKIKMEIIQVKLKRSKNSKDSKEGQNNNDNNSNGEDNSINQAEENVKTEVVSNQCKSTI